MIDLVSLIEQCTSVRLSKVANNRLHGTEYASACPFCGGNDRFHVFPESSSPKPHWFCRVCGVSGDHIDILVKCKGLSYVEACNELGLEPGETIAHSAPTFFDDTPPCKEWQAMSRTLIERAQKFLWKDTARHALNYLKDRGLTDETIMNANLGYVPLIDGQWFQSPFSDWGLTEDMLTQKQKEKGCVRVPNGILIPWTADKNIWKLAVKRFEAGENEPRYGQVLGSRDAMYGIDSLARNKPVLLVEGEIDALSAHQEAGDLVACVATGSADKARIPLWIARLGSMASSTLVAFDVDKNGAGEKGASYWIETLPNAMRWPPYAHDVNEALQKGIDIRAWVETGLLIATAPAMPEPISRITYTGEIKVVIQEIEPMLCCLCKIDLATPDYFEMNAYYDEEGHLFCEKCWTVEDEEVEQVMVGATIGHVPADDYSGFQWRDCPQCKKPVFCRGLERGICEWCYIETLPPMVATKQPLFVKR